MTEEDPMAISSKVEYLISETSDDPRVVLTELVRRHGPEMTAKDARIVFGSWRSRIDLVEDTLKDVLAEHGHTAL